MKDSRHEAERWIRQAENDLEFGRLALREGYFHQACFVAHQAAEKGLKSVLYGLGARIVLGHSLVELVGRLSEDAPEVASHLSGAGILDQYFVPTRYPNGLPGGVPFEAFGETQARDAIEEAERVVSLARRRLASSPESQLPDSERE